jgi:hypothetical protein
MMNGATCSADGSSHTCTCNVGWSGVQCDQPECPSCATFNEYQACATTLTRTCCEGSAAARCVSGVPTSCIDEGDATQRLDRCAHMVSSTNATCDVWLRTTPMMSTVLQQLGNAAETCARSCTSFEEFQRNAAAINAECCDEPDEDCSGGLPSMCNAGCAAVLLPVYQACDAWLGTTTSLSAPYHALQAAASLCRVDAGGGH